MTVLRRVQTTFADGPSIDSFGRQRTSCPLTLFDSKQLYDNQPLFWDDQEVSGSGTSSTHNVDTASTVMAVSATTAGRRIRQTYQSFNYQPGKSQLVFLTGTLSVTGGGTGIVRAAGLYDANNGIFMRDNEGTVEAVIRSSDTGSPVDDAVARDDWNVDKFDGTGPSGKTFDPSASQIIVFDFEWLGVGRVRIGFVIDGAVYYGHEFQNSNINAGVYMSTPNLPIRYEISNDGTGAASSLEQICSTVISEGGQQETGIIRSASTEGTHVDCTVENTVYAIIGIRLKSSYIGSVINLLNYALQIQTVDDQLLWSIRFNPTVAGTFTYSDVTSSALQVATGATANTVTGGTIIDEGFVESQGGLFGTGSAGSASGMIENALKIGAAIDGTVDEIVLCVQPVGGSTAVEVEGSLTWRELL